MGRLSFIVALCFAVALVCCILLTSSSVDARRISSKIDMIHRSGVFAQEKSRMMPIMKLTNSFISTSESKRKKRKKMSKAQRAAAKAAMEALALENAKLEAEQAALQLEEDKKAYAANIEKEKAGFKQQIASSFLAKGFDAAQIKAIETKLLTQCNYRPFHFPRKSSQYDVNFQVIAPGTPSKFTRMVDACYLPLIEAWDKGNMDDIRKIMAFPIPPKATVPPSTFVHPKVKEEDPAVKAMTADQKFHHLMTLQRRFEQTVAEQIKAAKVDENIVKDVLYGSFGLYPSDFGISNPDWAFDPQFVVRAEFERYKKAYAAYDKTKAGKNGEKMIAFLAAVGMPAVPAKPAFTPDVAPAEPAKEDATDCNRSECIANRGVWCNEKLKKQGFCASKTFSWKVETYAPNGAANEFASHVPSCQYFNTVLTHQEKREANMLCENSNEDIYGLDGLRKSFDKVVAKSDCENQCTAAAQKGTHFWCHEEVGTADDYGVCAIPLARNFPKHSAAITGKVKIVQPSSCKPVAGTFATGPFLPEEDKAQLDQGQLVEQSC